LEQAMQDREAINTHVQKLKRNQVGIRRRHMDVTIMLVKRSVADGLQRHCRSSMSSSTHRQMTSSSE
jgi:hypothetical protein